MREIFFSEEIEVASFMNNTKSGGLKKIIHQERLKERKRWMMKIKKQRCRMIIMVLVFLVILTIMPLLVRFSAIWQERAFIPDIPDGMEKVYGEIQIEKGDTLTSIAKEVIDEKNLGSYYRIQDMKYEIATINGIYDTDTIYQDDKLLFPYYIYNREITQY